MLAVYFLDWCLCFLVCLVRLVVPTYLLEHVNIFFFNLKKNIMVRICRVFEYVTNIEIFKNGPYYLIYNLIKILARGNSTVIWLVS